MRSVSQVFDVVMVMAITMMMIMMIMVIMVIVVIHPVSIERTKKTGGGFVFSNLLAVGGG